MNTLLRRVALCAACLPLSVSAAEREHAAHEHGHVLLQVAVDGNQFFIEMRSPAINIVGFEHEARTEADKAAVSQARHELENYSALFVTNDAARCSLQSVSVESSLLKEHDEHDDEEKEVHSEFHAHYTVQCKNPGSLTKVAVNLFDRFPGIEEIDAQVISANGQTSVELEPDQAVIVFP